MTRVKMKKSMILLLLTYACCRIGVQSLKSPDDQSDRKPSLSSEDSSSSESRDDSSPHVTVTLSSGNKSSSFVCPEQFGYYDDVNDCSKYYVCVFGEALQETCTGGLYFSAELQTCDWPRNIPCKKGNKTSSSSSPEKSLTSSSSLELNSSSSSSTPTSSSTTTTELPLLFPLNPHHHHHGGEDDEDSSDDHHLIYEDTFKAKKLTPVVMSSGNDQMPGSGSVKETIPSLLPENNHTIKEDDILLDLQRSRSTAVVESADSSPDDHEDNSASGGKEAIIDRRIGIPVSVPHFQNQRLQQQQHFRRSVPSSSSSSANSNQGDRFSSSRKPPEPQVTGIISFTSFDSEESPPLDFHQPSSITTSSPPPPPPRREAALLPSRISSESERGDLPVFFDDDRDFLEVRGRDAEFRTSSGRPPSSPGRSSSAGTTAALTSFTAPPRLPTSGLIQVPPPRLTLPHQPVLRASLESGFGRPGPPGISPAPSSSIPRTRNRRPPYSGFEERAASITRSPPVSYVIDHNGRDPGSIIDIQGESPARRRVNRPPKRIPQSQIQVRPPVRVSSTTPPTTIVEDDDPPPLDGRNTPPPSSYINLNRPDVLSATRLGGVRDLGPIDPIVPRRPEEIPPRNRPVIVEVTSPLPPLHPELPEEELSAPPAGPRPAPVSPKRQPVPFLTTRVHRLPQPTTPSYETREEEERRRPVEDDIPPPRNEGDFPPRSPPLPTSWSPRPVTPRPPPSPSSPSFTSQQPPPTRGFPSRPQRPPPPPQPDSPPSTSEEDDNGSGTGSVVHDSDNGSVTDDVGAHHHHHSHHHNSQPVSDSVDQPPPPNIVLNVRSQPSPPTPKLSNNQVVSRSRQQPPLRHSDPSVDDDDNGEGRPGPVSHAPPSHSPSLPSRQGRRVRPSTTNNQAENNQNGNNSHDNSDNTKPPLTRPTAQPARTEEPKPPSFSLDDAFRTLNGGLDHGVPLGLGDFPIDDDKRDDNNSQPTSPSVPDDDRPSRNPSSAPPPPRPTRKRNAGRRKKKKQPNGQQQPRRLPEGYRRLPSRPPPIYETPRPLETASKCDPSICILPDCNCGHTAIPGGLHVKKVPQIVLLTFDDAVNDLNWEIYEEIFNSGRKNPNGCPPLGTFYVSHEWTDYGQVQTLYSRGHEMASHGVTHSFGEKFSKNQWTKEIHGQREILHLYGGVKLEDVRGMRAPFLQVGGNRMFEMLYDANFTYDSSMPVFDNKPPFYPYTLDYAINHECMITPCPTKSFPGLWEVGMVMWEDLNGNRCSMGDACSNPNNDDGVFEMLLKNFNRHYKTNRAPFGLFYHSAWFNTEHHKKGFMRFLDEIMSHPDVFLTTNWQMLQWMRDPTPLERINSFGPWRCDKSNPDNDRPEPCTYPSVCNVKHGTGSRFMKTCQPCPVSYPWVGNTGWV